MKLAARILFFALLGCAAGAIAGQPAPQPDIRDLMSARQFQQAGLNKLTPQQLAALNAWLDGYLQAHPAAKAAPAAPSPTAAAKPPATPATTAAPASSPAPVTAPPVKGEAAFGAAPAKPKPEEVPDHIVSYITGTFDGFYSGAVFKLDNGQVWKETDSTMLKVRLEHPKVIIKKAWVGYLMRVDGYGKQVFVTRVK